MMEMISLIQPVLIKIWNCIVGIVLWLNIRSLFIYFQLGSCTQMFKDLAFEAILLFIFRMKLSFQFLLKLVEFKEEKIISLLLLKNVKTFVNTTSMDICFGMPTIYIGFC